MDRREHARRLREAARRFLDDAIGVAERLYAVADEIDPRTCAVEPATDRAGGGIGMSLAELAAGRAMTDFLAEDPDNDDDREDYALDAIIASALLGIDIPPEVIHE